jgi:hypothetical protein
VIESLIEACGSKCDLRLGRAVEAITPQGDAGVLFTHDCYYLIWLFDVFCAEMWKEFPHLNLVIHLVITMLFRLHAVQHPPGFHIITIYGRITLHSPPLRLHRASSRWYSWECAGGSRVRLRGDLDPLAGHYVITM